jgi:hypothetical protein
LIKCAARKTGGFGETFGETHICLQWPPLPSPLLQRRRGRMRD